MALDEAVRATICPGSTLTENANLLVMPNPDVARMGEDCLHLSAVVLDFPSPRFASLLVYLSQLVSTPNAPPPPRRVGTLRGGYGLAKEFSNGMEVVGPHR